MWSGNCPGWPGWRKGHKNIKANSICFVLLPRGQGIIVCGPDQVQVQCHESWPGLAIDQSVTINPNLASHSLVRLSYYWASAIFHHAVPSSLHDSHHHLGEGYLVLIKEGCIFRKFWDSINQFYNCWLSLDPPCRLLVLQSTSPNPRINHFMNWDLVRQKHSHDGSGAGQETLNESELIFCPPLQQNTLQSRFCQYGLLQLGNWSKKSAWESLTLLCSLLVGSL